MNEVKKKRVMLSAGALMIAVLFFAAGFFTGRATMDESVGRPTLDVPVYEGAGGLMVSSDEGSGVSVVSEKISPEHYDEYGVMPTAESAYTVTATVSGPNLTEEQQGVTWSAAAFKNPASEWATGKNAGDYITAQASGNSITVSCTKAFGEQIVITCTSVYNKSAAKDLTLDYKQRANFHIAFTAQDLTDSQYSGEKTWDVENDRSEQFRFFLIKSDVYTVENDAKAEIVIKPEPTGIKETAFGGRDDLWNRLPEYTIQTSEQPPYSVTIDHFFDRTTVEHMFLDGLPDTFQVQQYIDLMTILQSDFSTPLLYSFYISFTGEVENADRIPGENAIVCQIVFPHEEIQKVAAWAEAYMQMSVNFEPPYADGNLIY